MNSDTLAQLLQKGFHLTLGATATLVETLQDPQRREANVSKLSTELSQLAEEWEAKGATTEVEARNFVSNLWQQSPTAPSTSPTPASSTSGTTPPDEVQQDLQTLTAQISAIREEIERLRADGNT